jgi:putative Mg2+ transporter-C (MgtC) family protein
MYMGTEIESILDALLAVNLRPMALAILVGGMIGAEREIHGRPAGFRTHIMVCLSSTLLIQASQIQPQFLPTSDSPLNLVWDPNRLAAGVVTGIGFLGAAAVIRSGDIVRGITTGACVWAVAVLGVVIGRGAYAEAFVGALVMLGVLVGFDRALGWANPIVYRRMRVHIGVPSLAEAKDILARLLQDSGVGIQDVSGKRENSEDALMIELHLRCRNRLQAPGLLDQVCELPGVVSAEWSMLQD